MRRRPRRGKPASGALPRYAVVMAGGHGTRFWPRSRRRVPKQLLAITGRRTLLQETVQRLRPLFAWNRILVVTNRDHAAAVRRQLPRLAADQVLAEPQGRNTLACIALAAEWIAARAPQATMVVTPADHVVKDAAGFRHTVERACNLAEAGDNLVTLGIRPSGPETAYGYIEVGRSIGGFGSGVAAVARFREKPAAAMARRYLRSGRFLWNAGIFVWRTEVLGAALAEFAPRVQERLRGVFDAGRRGLAARLGRVYRDLESVPIDVAVMEPAAGRKGLPHVAVIAAPFDWSDVGSWAAMPDVLHADEQGNAFVGTLVSIDSSDSIVYSPDRLVALVGVRDLIVVESEDAILVCRRDCAQDVRKVTQALERRGWKRYL